MNCARSITTAASLFLAVLGLGAAPAFATEAPSVLPLPQFAKAAPGAFRPSRATVISIPRGDAGAAVAAERIADFFLKSRGLRLAIVSEGTARASAIRLVRAPGLAPEGYRLSVAPAGVTISATGDAGLFYGGVTLWQLATQPGTGAIAAVEIQDAPRFAWRGLMLDSARNFQSPVFVRHFIDWMAANKLNTLHWHLVDDQGWRIEIKKYPRLTQVAAWRSPAVAPGAPALPRTGGYYTQAEIRAIVAYAAARQITIVPEIEMPGHALSPIRAYPDLGVGPVPPKGIESDWGVFPYLFNTEDRSFAFLEDVLRETMALFPSRYIHVGGDEAVKDQWRASPAVQARMRALGVADEKALQSWFIHRIETFLNRNGRKLIGWDEILEGGLAPSATVMSWRGIDGAITAAKAGHDTVLAPDPDLYLNHRQGSTAAEPPGRGALLPLARVYAFNPAPDTLTADQQRHILGLQGNLWSEHMRTEERVAYMAYPRAMAIAEIGWSSGRHHDLGEFAGRVAQQLDRLRGFGLTGSYAAFTPAAESRFDPATGRVAVTLRSEIGAPIRYTVDGSVPGPAARRYTQPLSLTLPTRLRAASFGGAGAFPGAFDHRFDAVSVRRRDDSELKLCGNDLVLQLEDDFPAKGPRASFLTNLFAPCWIYQDAPLDGVTGIAVDVGQIPFNFQIGKDIEKIRFRTPATRAGEIEVRLGGCDGERIAVLPLATAAANPGVTTLRAPIAPRKGSHDLCLTYTATGPNPIWAVDAVQLVTGR